MREIAGLFVKIDDIDLRFLTSKFIVVVENPGDWLSQLDCSNTQEFKALKVACDAVVSSWNSRLTT